MINLPITQKKFAEMIGKTPKTLQRWDASSLFKARRNPAGEPFYLPEDLENYLQINTSENNGLQGDDDADR